MALFKKLPFRESIIQHLDGIRAKLDSKRESLYPHEVVYPEQKLPLDGPSEKLILKVVLDKSIGTDLEYTLTCSRPAKSKKTTVEAATQTPDWPKTDAGSNNRLFSGSTAVSSLDLSTPPTSPDSPTETRFDGLRDNDEEISFGADSAEIKYVDETPDPYGIEDACEERKLTNPYEEDEVTLGTKPKLPFEDAVAENDKAWCDAAKWLRERHRNKIASLEGYIRDNKESVSNCEMVITGQAAVLEERERSLQDVRREKARLGKKIASLEEAITERSFLHKDCESAYLDACMKITMLEDLVEMQRQRDSELREHCVTISQDAELTKARYCDAQRELWDCNVDRNGLRRLIDEQAKTIAAGNMITSQAIAEKSQAQLEFRDLKEVATQLLDRAVYTAANLEKRGFNVWDTADAGLEMDARRYGIISEYVNEILGYRGQTNTHNAPSFYGASVDGSKITEVEDEEDHQRQNAGPSTDNGIVEWSNGQARSREVVKCLNARVQARFPFVTAGQNLQITGALPSVEPAMPAVDAAEPDVGKEDNGMLEFERLCDGDEKPDETMEASAAPAKLGPSEEPTTSFQAGSFWQEQPVGSPAALAEFSGNPETNPMCKQQVEKTDASTTVTNFPSPIIDFSDVCKEQIFTFRAGSAPPQEDTLQAGIAESVEPKANDDGDNANTIFGNAAESLNSGLPESSISATSPALDFADTSQVFEAGQSAEEHGEPAKKADLVKEQSNSVREPFVPTEAVPTEAIPAEAEARPAPIQKKVSRQERRAAERKAAKELLKKLKQMK